MTLHDLFEDNELFPPDARFAVHQTVERRTSNGIPYLDDVCRIYTPADDVIPETVGAVDFKRWKPAVISSTGHIPFAEIWLPDVKEVS